MSSRTERTGNAGAPDAIISPCAQTTSSVRGEGSGGRKSWPLWIVSAALAAVVLANAGYFAVQYLRNPYRTLEPFAVDRYLADFQPMAGSKFGADLKVVADLGWKEGVGRLMVFSGTNDSRPILVMIPPKLSGVTFSKGQSYQVALEVGEGGLIYADSCDKD